MKREEAVEIACRHAAAEGRSYYSEGFVPHEWVVNAILEAGNRPRPNRSELLYATFPHDTQEEPCVVHPCAPHDFLRNASLSEDRYVCECSGWEPPAECDGTGACPACTPK